MGLGCRVGLAVVDAPQALGPIKNEKFRRSPNGDQNTNLDDVGARIIRVEDKVKNDSIPSHTDNQQQTSIFQPTDRDANTSPFV